jgi:maltose-binding protein MalE
MSIKKRIIAVAALMAVAAGAIYSSTLKMSGADENVGRLLGSSEKETLYFWYADENLTDYVESAAVSFGDKEGVRILPVLVSDGKYLEAISQASLKNEQLPDLYLLGNDSLERAYLAGLASDVRDVKTIMNNDYFPQTALNAVSYKGHLTGYPLCFETSALIYNETYMREWAKQQAMRELANAGEGEEEQDSEISEEEAAGLDEAEVETLAANYLANGIPQTVNDILNIADSFDVPEGVEGIMKWDVSDIFYNYWFVGRYAVVGGEAGDDPANVSIENSEVESCLEVYKSLNQFFSMEADTIDYDSVMQDFIDGKIVYTIGTTDAVERLEAAKKEGTFAYEYGIAQMPDVTSELASSSMSVTTAVVVNGYSMHKDTANRFAAYLSAEYADELYQRTGKVPACIKTALPYEGLEIYRMEYTQSTPLPKLMETANFWMHMEVLFSKIWNGADVADSVHTLSEQINVQLGVTSGQ